MDHGPNALFTILVGSLFFLAQNWIRLEPDPFRARPLDYLGKKLRPFTTLAPSEVGPAQGRGRSVSRLIWRIRRGTGRGSVPAAAPPSAILILEEALPHPVRSALDLVGERKRPPIFGMLVAEGRGRTAWSMPAKARTTCHPGFLLRKDFPRFIPKRR